MYANDVEPEGYSAEVHQSLLEQILWKGVPYQMVLANLISTVILCITFHWPAYLPMGGVWHGLAWLMHRGDPERLQTVLGYLSLKDFYDHS
jgi:type IV secretory pathway TrbD component